MVLLASSLHGLQNLLCVIEDVVNEINMTFNTKKTACMVFNPCIKRKVVCSTFPVFKLAGSNLLFVDNLKYMGHIIDNNLCDDGDIYRELKSLFVRASLLCRRFHRCSLQVKLKLFVHFVFVL